MTRALRARGDPSSEDRVDRLVREHDIHARHKQRFKVTTNSKHKLPVASRTR
jgi:transposase InsO family protein